MESQERDSATTSSERRAANLLGFYASIVVAALTAITFAIGVLTPPISGPFCMQDCIQYPFLDSVARFPRDYFWMFPAIVLSLVFIVQMACVHEYAHDRRRIFGLIGLAFALLSATILIIDYFVQISVVQPSLVNGETAGISLLTQYNPHGIFIALEEIGYLMASLAFAAVIPVFAGSNGVERAMRWLFAVSFVLSISALAGFSVVYGIHREYRLEVFLISIVWIEMIAAGILASIVFRRAVRATALAG